MMFWLSQVNLKIKKSELTMKTMLTTVIICISLYAGIGAIKNTTDTLTKHNQETQKALALLK